MRKLGLGPALLVMLALVVGAVACGTSSPAPTASPAQTTVSDLLAEFEANEVAADAKYGDKIVRLTGVVDTIDKDVFGTPHVRLTTGSFFGSGVDCYFRDDAEPDLAQLSKGQTATVEGKLLNRHLLGISMEGCSIVH